MKLPALRKDRDRLRSDVSRRRKALGPARRKVTYLIHRIKGGNAKIRLRNRQIAAQTGDPGTKAVRYLLGFAGRTESPYGSNDSPFLAAWRAKLPSLSWMRGQPWCGFACIAAWQFGAHKRLPDDTVSTVAIANRAARGDGFRRVSFSDIRPGDLVVMHFGSGGPKHVALATGPAKNGAVPTIEGNTSSSNAGSQSNGGGVFVRSRSLGLVHTVARPI